MSHRSLWGALALKYCHVIWIFLEPWDLLGGSSGRHGAVCLILFLGFARLSILDLRLSLDPRSNLHSRSSIERRTSIPALARQTPSCPAPLRKAILPALSDSSALIPLLLTLILFTSTISPSFSPLRSFTFLFSWHCIALLRNASHSRSWTDLARHWIM